MATKREPIRLSSVRAAHAGDIGGLGSSAALLEGLSALAGEHFFKTLSRSLAVALNMRFGYVAEIAEEPGRLKLLAFWDGEAFRENVVFSINGRPCEHILAKDLVVIHKSLQKRYPEDASLGEIGAESYMAVPLLASDSSPLGHIGVLHDAPIVGSTEEVAVLRAFAARAVGELLRNDERAAAEQTDDILGAILGAPLGILQLDQTGKISLANRRLEAMFGYEQGELLGQPIERLVPSPLRRRHREDRKVFLRDPHDRPMGANLDIVGRRKDGSTFPVTISLSGDGGITTAFVADATTLREAADPNDDQARLEAVVHAFPEMTFIISGEGVYQDYETADGVDPYVPPEAFLGKSVGDVMPEELAGRILTCIKLALKTHKVQRLAYELDMPDGTHSYEARIVRLDKDRVAAFVRDYTAEEWLIDDADREARLKRETSAATRMEWRNPYRLSYREFSILHMLKGGTTDKEIASELGISVFTVNKHVSNILMKMNAVSRTEATIRALQEGLID